MPPKAVKPVSKCLITSASLLVLAACSGDLAPIDLSITCHIGSYRTAGGGVIDLAPLSTPALRWRSGDGRTGRLEPDGEGGWTHQLGWTDQPHPARFALGSCDDGRIEVDGMEGLDGEASRIDFPITETEFESGGETLVGRLILPEGEGPFPLVVLVHGSEQSSARQYYYMQRLLPARGLATFVYDKRGTGASSGDYTQDFHLLADDAVNALAEARRLGGDQLGEAGYLGTSQGGWVAPLAASQGGADFVIAAYGMAEGALAEDREEVLLSLIEAGYGDDDAILAGGRALAAAAGRLMASDFSDSWHELASLKRQYRDEDWYDAIEGEFTHEFLVRPIWQVWMAMPFFDKGTSWDYEPRPVLAALDIPALWILSEDDREAPPATTRVILSELQAEGAPIDVAVFPNSGHGMIQFDLAPDGSRLETRYAEGYFDLLVDWAQTREPADGDGDADLQ
ncbi:alpha/beta hydrolase [uncultured Maricaulis sp.]|uniref:alpha/beta hydrolase family protein n=1 Tax=uncultured Maricaulis sp. TaxID=174710 RepID=UPI00261F602F|nr:alpha/beta hydrolase [uncultured Maricaulis sp.]